MRQIVCSYLKRKGITLLRGNQTEIRLSTAHFIRNVWPWRWISRWVAERIKTRAKKVSGCSKLISGGKTITLEPSDGNETITKAGDVFTDWIDSDFRNYGTDVRSQKTGKINTEVHELIKDGDYQKIFGSLSEDPKKLCFTQLQIIQFVKNHREWLGSNYWTLFLFEANGELFVAGVYLRHLGGSLGIRMHRFSHDCVWSAEYRPRIVVPQLTP